MAATHLVARMTCNEEDGNGLRYGLTKREDDIQVWFGFVVSLHVVLHKQRFHSTN